MNYTKSVIALVFEIRKKVPPEFRDDIKLTNPKLDIELVGLYKTSDDVIVQALIKEVLLQMKSEAFYLIAPEATLESKPVKTKAPKKRFRIYRGKKIEEEVHEETLEPPTLSSLAGPDGDSQKKSKPKRIYRGKVID